MESYLSAGDTEPFSASIEQRVNDIHPPRAQQDQRCEWGPESSSTDPQSLTDVLRIVPTNDKAKLAFDDLVKRKLDDKLSEHHAQYIVTTHKGFLETSSARQPRPSDETTSDEGSVGSASTKQIHLGYFRVSFDCPRVRKDVQFVLGRGSGKKFGSTRDVDILLAVGEKNFTNYTKGLKAAHAYLKIHPRSGAWLFHAGHDSAPPAAPQTTNVIAILDKDELMQNEYRPLGRPNTILEINGMCYEVRFTITKVQQEIRYLEQRNEALEAARVHVPDTSISGIPFDVDVVTKSAVFRRGLGSGTFGRVFEGFDRKAGDLRVVKKIHLNSKHNLRSVEEELHANRLFNCFEGIVTTYECSNSEGGEGTIAETFPIDVFLVQERGIAFSQHAWAAEDPVNWGLRAILLRQLLQGLEAIHRHGCMHRDITPMNILYFDQDPKHAGLCDFGKICYSRTDTETALAAWKYLPPEIERKESPKERKTYDQKVDIWMLGLAIIHSWYPHIVERLAPRKHDQYSAICSNLCAETQSGLAGLLVRMISWKAKDRPSAQQAMDDPCLKSAVAKQPEPVKSSDRKRPPSPS